MKPDKLIHTCRKCSVSSKNPPKVLYWGHSCWGRDANGNRISACESHIETEPDPATLIKDLQAQVKQLQSERDAAAALCQKQLEKIKRLEKKTFQSGTVYE